MRPSDVQKSIRFFFLWTFLVCYTITAFAGVLSSSQSHPYYKNSITDKSPGEPPAKHHRPFWSKKKHIVPGVKRQFQASLPTDYAYRPNLDFQRCEYAVLH